MPNKTDNPVISVVVCTYSRSAQLKIALSSMARMTVPASLAWEIVVIDNNSTDDTAAVVKEFAKTSGLDVRCVLETAQGLSNARNRGIAEARGETIVFTDDDVEVEKDWLAQIAEGLAENGDCIAVAGKVLPQWEVPKPSWFYDDGPYSLRGVIVHFDLGDQKKEITTSPFGANMAIRKAAFTKYGVFRTDLGRCKDQLMSLDETEFFDRLFKGKERVAYWPEAVVYHPVPMERVQKKYIQSFFFNLGRAEVRVQGVPQHLVSYGGVPRFWLRMAASKAAAWMFSFAPKDRFQNKLLVYRTAGMIAEARKVMAAGAFASRAAERS